MTQRPLYEQHVSGPALAAFLRVSAAWALEEPQERMLLGQPAPETLRSWKTHRTGALSLDPAGPRSTWSAYYESRLGSGSYGVIALFYTTTFSLVPLPGGDLLKPDASTQDLLALAADNSKEPGLAALTQALEADPRYQLAAQGPYDSANDYAIYAIWRKQAQA